MDLPVLQTTALCTEMKGDVVGGKKHTPSRQSVQSRQCHYVFSRSTLTLKALISVNKCIGDDAKAAARQSLNCIKNKKKIKYGEKRFPIWRMEILHGAMWHDRDIDFAR